MFGKMKIQNICLFLFSAVVFASCEKVSPTGLLIAGTAVEDRVKMSSLFYREYQDNRIDGYSDGGYTFLVGADSHVTDDTGRMEEMLQIGLDNDDMFYAHLGDIADTKAEYYINLDKAISKYKEKFLQKLNEQYVDGPITYDDVIFPFFPVVGNHDITHNGWALWSNLFHSSFYEFNIEVAENTYDHFIFLDSASGTLGETQIDLIEQGILDGNSNGERIRNTFVFTHTNIFRPSSLQFASTFTREETFFLLNQFRKWNATIVFCGHVHKWDDRVYGGVTYLTLDSMCEKNSPEPGDYLVRVHVDADGAVTWERVRMNYTKKKK